MRSGLFIAVFLCMCLVVACAPAEQKAPEESMPKIPQNEEPEPVPKQEPELTPEQRCYENAKELIPETLSLSIASSHNPNSTGWDLDTKEWTDGTEINIKGDIEFIKGRLEGENTEYWYPRNNQNEKLFGIGGLKYSKKVTASDGRAGENIFMIKPILSPLIISHPREPFDPYEGSFEIVDYGFTECSWLE